jgi:hypothetical protein
VSQSEVGSRYQLPNSTVRLLEGENEEEKNHNGVSDECSVQSSKVLIEKVADGFCQVPTVSC